MDNRLDRGSLHTTHPSPQDRSAVPSRGTSEPGAEFIGQLKAPSGVGSRRGLSGRGPTTYRPITEYGEGPFWDEATGLLLIVDMLRGDVLALDEDGEELFRHHMGDVAAVIRARRGGGYVVAMENGFTVLDASFHPVGHVVHAFDDPSVRVNDGDCSPRGRFRATSRSYREDREDRTGTIFPAAL